jgi:phospholipase C
VAKVHRREFLGAVGGAALSAFAADPLARFASLALPSRAPHPPRTPRILDRSAAHCPIDTVVVVMMENRSFDHYLGWLADDPEYLEAGRRRYGDRFAVAGRVEQTFTDPQGVRFATQRAGQFASEKVESRGCTLRIPGHSWDRARIERDHGFLAAGTGNDAFAISYYTAEGLPMYAALARRFTIFDHWHSSLLGPTFPNRQYLLSGQSEGRKTNPGLKANPRPLDRGVFRAETIFERLARGGVETAYYHTNVPLLALWGTSRTGRFIRSVDRYFEDAAAGRLPAVAFVEPQFGGGDASRTDDHPRGDVALGQRWVREIVRAFVQSPHWRSGAFILTYDEGGGFFDHVAPPQFPDARASRVDSNNFGQGGFRVPTLLASPYAAPGAVDHRRYDHTSILRFLEWRFLGAPAEGSARSGNWAMSMRDRGAANMGVSLRAKGPDPDLGFDLDMRIPQPAPNCTAAQEALRLPDVEGDPFDIPDLADLSETSFPGATYRPWLDDVTTKLQ